MGPTETGPPDPLEADCACGPDPAAAPPDPPAAPDRRIAVLLIDDDHDDYLLTRDLLADVPGAPYALDWVTEYDDGLEAVCTGTHQAFLLDYRLGARTGIELLREAQVRGCSGPVILLTGQGQGRTDADALAVGASDYLEKAGLTTALLDRAIRYALARHSAEAELERKVKERTEELGRLNDALRDADRRKDEFLSTLGHELRNPLAPIRNALEILRLADDNADVVRRQRERLDRQVAQLVRLIDDLLDVSRVSAGKLRLALEPLTLQDILDAAIDLSRPHLDAAGLDLVLDLPAAAVRLTADRVRLAQVFSNLLNNAAKYSDRGGRVTVSAAATFDRVTVRVADTGVGIPADVLPHIFDLFTQVDRTLNRSQGGLGVGLALVKRLVELHGGLVTAHSDGPGTGAVFTIDLPMIPPL